MNLADENKTKEIIEEVFINSLQEMGFIDVIPATKNSELKKAICIKISILMPFLNEIYIAFTPTIAQNIAQNILGDEFSPEKIRDTIAEFANVYAGKMLDALSPNMLFELGYPEQSDYKQIKKDEFTIHTFMTPEGEMAQLFRKFKSI